MFGRSAAAWSANASRPQRPTDRLAAELEALALGEQLGQMLIVAPGVATTRERHYLVPRRRRHRTRRVATAVAVHERPNPLFLVGRLQAAELLFGEAHRRCCLSHRPFTRQDAVERQAPLLFTRLHQE